MHNDTAIDVLKCFIDYLTRFKESAPLNYINFHGCSTLDEVTDWVQYLTIFILFIYSLYHAHGTYTTLKRSDLSFKHNK